MHPLISVEELETIREEVVLCDLRWDLIDPDKGRTTYEKGHIPGAVFVDLDADLAAAPGEAGRHPLPDPGQFASTLASLGISPDSHVVVYDDVGGRIAARLWWMLRSIGHGSVQVLDGGYQAWTAAGNDVGVGTVTAELAHYPNPSGFSGVVRHEELPGRTVVDARAGERYRGETEPVDPKAGHIPGAINIPTDANLAIDGRFLLGADLKDVYGEVPDGAVVSCGSGVTACHDALAMVLAGRPMPDVYVGSFSEWSRLDLPVNTGPNP
jgi:thiosulfate/3-mercaptopyruvate sulfurtransferase